MCDEQQLALVTGAGSGIGKEIATELALQGYCVVLTDRAPALVEQAVDEIKLQLESGGSMSNAGAVCGVVLDVTEHVQAQAVFEALPRLDVLVNNAGIFNVKPLVELSAADFRQMYEVNTVAIFALCQLAAQKMSAGARIINIASRSMLGAKEYIHYATSKAAVIGLTRSLALALAAQQITVNAVAPGVIETDMLKARSDTNLDALRALQPMKRLGQPGDIARAVAFFAQPDNQFITGQVLLVDGGRSLSSAAPY